MGRPKKNKDQKTTEYVPTPVVESNDMEQSKDQTSDSIKYVVVRDSKRVSDIDYTSPTDPIALAEAQFWTKVITRWPDGTKVEIVPFDKKKHRIY